MAPEKDTSETKDGSWDLKSPATEAEKPADDTKSTETPKEETAAAVSTPFATDPLLPGEKAKDEVPSNAPSPLTSPTPLPVGGATSGNKRKKMILLIVGAILAFLLIAAGAAYAMYNNPDRVLGDAFSKAIAAKNMTVKGNMTTKSSEGESKVAFDYARGDDFAQKADLTINYSAAPLNVNVSGNFIADKNGDMYVKLANSKQIVQNLLGAYSAGSQFDSVIALVDNKWVKFANANDAENKNSNPLACYQDLQAELSSRKTGDQIRNLYEANTFVRINKELAAENVNGVDSVHYDIKLDEAKAKAFVNAYKQTEAYKKFVKCDASSEMKESDVTESGKEFNQPTFEVWVSRWSHELTRVKVNGSNDGDTYSVVAEPTFNRGVDVEIPKQTVPFETVMQEFQKALFSGSGFSDGAM